MAKHPKFRMRSPLLFLMTLAVGVHGGVPVNMKAVEPTKAGQIGIIPVHT